MPLVGQQVRETLAEQDAVLGDHDPHGISTIRTVGPPSGESRCSSPSSAPTRSRRPARPAAFDEGRAADAVVLHLDRQTVAAPTDGDVARVALRVLRDVGERLAHDEVGGGLDRCGRPLCDVDAHLDRHGGTCGERRQGRVEPPVGEHGRVDPAGQVAHLGDRALGLLVRLVDELLRPPGSVSSFSFARPRSIASETRRCCTPSCRSRSIRRRSSAARSTAAARESVNVCDAREHVAAEQASDEVAVRRRETADDPRREQEDSGADQDQRGVLDRRVDHPAGPAAHQIEARPGIEGDLDPGVERVHGLRQRPRVHGEEQERGPEHPEGEGDREREGADRQQQEVVDDLGPGGGVGQPRQGHAPPTIAGRVGSVRAGDVEVEQQLRARSLEPAHAARDVEHGDQDRDADQRDQQAETQGEARSRRS